MNEEISTNKIYNFTTNDLKKWALEYDEYYGQWPEHMYEGVIFYNFVMSKLDDKYIEIDADYPEDKGTIEWEKEMEYNSFLTNTKS